MSGKIFLFLQLYIVVVFCYKKQDKPCDANDHPCVTKSVSNVFDAAVNADPSAGFEAIDPMHHDIITANLPTVNLTLKDCTVVGHKGLQIESATISEHNTLYATIAIPRIEMSGTYEIVGSFLNTPVMGSGHFKFNATDIKVDVEGVKKFYKKNGKVYLKFKSFAFTTDLIGKLVLDAENLVIKNMDTADATSDFKGKMLSDVWYPAITKANMNKIFNNVNALLVNIPHADLVVEVPNMIIEEPEKPCKINDHVCITKIVSDVFTAAMHDNTAGFETVDPMHHDLVIASLPSVNFTLTDSTVTGLRDLEVLSAKVSDHNSVYITIMVPRYEMKGMCNVIGSFMTSQLNGNGHYDVNGTDIRIDMEAMKHFYNKNGEVILKIKGFEFTTELVGKLRLEADNLINGNKELNDAALKLINENDKVLAALWNPPITRANLDKIFVNVNKILEDVPLKQIVNEIPKFD